jgi:hypothetical protein
VFEGSYFQQAYVTRNVDAAVAMFSKRLGRSDIRAFEVTNTITTPAGVGELNSKLCMFWIGDVQIELIQPLGGMAEIYTDALPQDDSLAFHHVNFRLPDWHTFRTKVAAYDLPVALEGATDFVKYLYIDERATLGHYVEYCYMEEDKWQMMRNM